LWQLEEIRQKRAAERMQQQQQHNPPAAGDPYGWSIILLLSLPAQFVSIFAQYALLRC
jgi:hypothetical protein